MGYRFFGIPSTYGIVDIFVLIPALEYDLGPVEELSPVIKKGTTFRNESGVIFTLIEDVDFKHPSVTIVASKFDNLTGRATEYALRSSGRVKSSEYSVERELGDYVKFVGLDQWYK